jgi:DNA-binding MarR family transcriptional regulator
MRSVASSTTVIDQQAVADALLRQTARIRRVGRRRQGRPAELARLTGAQLELVKLVRRCPGVSVAQAAAELGLAANTVSTLVGRLTDERMLVRTPDPADRRIARLQLPERLARRVGAYRDRRMVALGAAIATLDPDQQATIAAATALLERVAGELERGVA